MPGCTVPGGARIPALVLALLTVGCAGGDEPQPAREPGGGALPGGMVLRLDRSNRDPAQFVVDEVPEGVHVVTGPAGILYHPDDRVQAGDFGVSAVFTEVAAPKGHREGYGLFVGGEDLDGPNQRYTYFLVRGDGRFLVKNRSGRSTTNVTDGWVASDAVELAQDGDATNVLSVRVEGGRVQFHCNGSRLAELDTALVATRGTVGLRINHNLDVLVEGFQIQR